MKNFSIALLRYSLVVILLWIGVMKFTAYEANGIKPLIENSPLMSWMYNFLSVQAMSNFLGFAEIIIAIGIALRPIAVKISGLASLAAIPMFLTTLTFLITTPGWEASLGGFPSLSAMPGQFILKDISLLAIAIFTAVEAFEAE